VSSRLDVPAAADPPQLGETLILHVRGGSRVCVPAQLGQITPYVLLEQEDWFEDEIRFVRRWLRPGMRVVDVGANYGVYTLAAAAAVGPSGRVWAFEPTENTARFLQRSLELNDAQQVLLSPFAVSDRAGEVPFLITRSPEQNAIATGDASAQGAVGVPATTLDEMAQRHGWAGMDFVKLDVEGHETQVVQGGAGFFRTASPLVMFEVRAGRTINLTALASLAALGYEIYELLPGPLLLVPFDRESIDQYQLNLFACKADRAAQLEAGGFLCRRGSLRLAPLQAGWGLHCGSVLYARELGARWPSKPGFLSGAGDKAYFRGLEAFAASRVAAQEPGPRAASLQEAFECVGVALESGASLARQLTYARLAWEMGRREAATGTLFLARQRLESEAQRAVEEPFLPPAERYDAVSPLDRPADWVRCAVIEQLERLRAYSSLYVRDTTPEVLGPIMELPFRSPEMDRRWQLAKMPPGEPPRPEPVPRLCVRSAENLNPQFWCSVRG
jgi:FkbM family methyltransferase